MKPSHTKTNCGTCTTKKNTERKLEQEIHLRCLRKVRINCTGAHDTSCGPQEGTINRVVLERHDRSCGPEESTKG